MKRILLVSILVIAATGLALAYTRRDRGHVQGSGEDEKEIKTLVAKMTEGFNRHDAKALVPLYTADADLVTIQGVWLKGAAEIEKGMQARFDTRLRETTLKTVGVTIRFIKPDVAIVHVRNGSSGLIESNGQKVPPSEELSTRVLIKENGKWRITAFHNTTVRASQSPAPEK